MAAADTSVLRQQSMEWSISETRREARFVCQGEVRLTLTSDQGREFLGQLVDVSNCGFRCAHQEGALKPGVEVNFVHKFFRGRARVVWSRLADGRMESGFLVVRE